MAGETIPNAPAGELTTVVDSTKFAVSGSQFLQAINLSKYIIGLGHVDVASAKILGALNSLDLAGTDGSTVDFGAGGTVLYAGGSPTFTAVTSVTFKTGAGNLNDQSGTAYSLLAADNGKFVRCTNAGAIALTIPSGLGVSYGCSIAQGGAGIVTLTAGGGVTLHAFGGVLTTAGQYAVAGIYAIAADSFLAFGNLA